MEIWLSSIVILVVVATAFFMAFDAWTRMRWRRRRLAIDIERYTALADVLAKREAAIVESRLQSTSWKGFRKLRVTRRERETHDVASFYLRPHDGQPLPGFRPGQFLTFRFHHDADREPSVRCYSLSQAHAPARDYRVTIKRLPPPDDAPEGTPHGEVSSYFHERVSEGSVVEVAPPSGHFTLDLSDGRPAVFIAGGIGITPFLPMLEHLHQHEPDREAWLFHGVKTRQDRVAVDQLQLWARRPSFHFVTCYSIGSGPENLGPFEAEGFVTTDILKRWLPSSNYEFYVCGPPAMMASVMTQLQDWKVPRTSIHYEAFTSESVQEVGAGTADLADAAPRQVSFRSAGKTLRWTPESGTILELAEAHGVFLPSGCRAGNCGTCAAPVLTGSFSALTQPEATVEEGSCLVCVSVPTEDIEFA